MEKLPQTDAALRNTAFHLLGYWKKTLPDGERSHLSRIASEHPTRVIAFLKDRLTEAQNTYLQSSYMWQCGAWETVEFQSSGEQYRMHVSANEAMLHQDERLLEIVIERSNTASG